MRTPSDFSVQQGKHFDAIVLSQDKEGVLADNPALRAEYEALDVCMGELSGKRILDFGCGTGRHALKMAKTAVEVIGIDISEKSIDTANRVAKEEGIRNFRGLVRDYAQPVYEHYFDSVLMVNVLHHIDDIDEALSSAKRSLKKDGRLIILEFNPLNVLFVPFLIIHGQVKAHFNTKYVRSNLLSIKRHLKKNRLNITYLKRYAFLPTILYNYSPIFQKINNALNTIPLVNRLCAFHIIRCDISK